jgi:hypothetical protein
MLSDRLSRLTCGLLLALSVGRGAAAQMPGDAGPPVAAPPAVPSAPAPAGTVAGPKVFVTDNYARLGTVDLGTRAVRIIGDMPSFLTDIAFCPGGVLYGIDFTQLFRINPTNAQRTLVGNLGVNDMNALVCNAAGTLLGEGFGHTTLYRISRTSGRATAVGSTAPFKSAGDLAYHEGSLFLSSTDKKLVKLNKTTGAPLSSKLHNITDLFGLVSTGTNKLYGFAGTKVYLMNEDTGGSKALFDFAGKGMGLTQGAAFNGNFQQ